MQHKKLDNVTYALRLQKGERLIESVLTFVREQKIAFARFTAIGAALDATLGFYHLERKEYEFTELSVPLEIGSLIGNITTIDDAPFVHMHGVLSDSTLSTYGGHIQELTVGGTAEIFLTVFPHEIKRALDADTGLKLWDLGS